MCLILLAHRYSSAYPLVVAANRDEYYRRPTRAAHFWEQAPQVLAGVDCQAGGTWLGITRCGRFAAITNYRDGNRPDTGKRSRGQLTQNFLQGDCPPAEYLRQVDVEAADYNGFNLLVGDGRELFYYSNRQNRITALAPAIYGLSNGLLDAAWPKVESGKSALARALQGTPRSAELLQILADDQRPSDSELPATGVPLAWERQLSSRFIRTADYGTRASTAIVVNGREVEFSERNFTGAGAIDGATSTFHFSLAGRPPQ